MVAEHSQRQGGSCCLDLSLVNTRSVTVPDHHSLANTHVAQARWQSVIAREHELEPFPLTHGTRGGRRELPIVQADRHVLDR